MRIGSQFSDNEKDLVLQVVRQSNSAELQAAYPSGYVFGLHGVEHVAELFFLLGRIGVAGRADVLVQFFVVVVFYILADGSQEAFLFAHFVLSATFRVHLHGFGHSFQFAAFHLFA